MPVFLWLERRRIPARCRSDLREAEFLARRVCRAVRHARYHVSITSLTGSLRPRGLDSRLGKVLRSRSLSSSKEFIVSSSSVLRCLTVAMAFLRLLGFATALQPSCRLLERPLGGPPDRERMWMRPLLSKIHRFAPYSKPTQHIATVLVPYAYW